VTQLFDFRSSCISAANTRHSFHSTKKSSSLQYFSQRKPTAPSPQFHLLLSRQVRPKLSYLPQTRSHCTSSIIMLVRMKHTSKSNRKLSRWSLISQSRISINKTTRKRCRFFIRLVIRTFFFPLFSSHSPFARQASVKYDVGFRCPVPLSGSNVAFPLR